MQRELQRGERRSCERARRLCLTPMWDFAKLANIQLHRARGWRLDSLD
jgi:hypothetical protein